MDDDEDQPTLIGAMERIAGDLERLLGGTYVIAVLLLLILVAVVFHIRV